MNRYYYTATYEVDGYVEAKNADEACELAAMDGFENLDNPIACVFVDAHVRLAPLPKNEGSTSNAD